LNDSVRGLARWGEEALNCPVCSVELKMADRQGVEVDYFPQRRGVWLDRGELDKIIERSAAFEVARGSEERPRRDSEERPREYRDRDDRPYEHRDRDEYYHKKKRRGFLEDLFDFD
jgi:uncharacterized protein